MNLPPKSPALLVDRPNEYERLVAFLLDQRFFLPVAINTSLPGGRGFGKTSLARAVCRDPRVLDAFADGIVWLTLGSRLTPLELMSHMENLIYDLTGQHTALENLEAGEQRLHELLHTRQTLLVIDEADDEEAMRPFLQAGPGGACLLITHADSSLPISARRVPVDIMMPREAVALLLLGLPPILDELPQGEAQAARPLNRIVKIVEGLADHLNDWPLLLSLVNGLLRSAFPAGLSGIPARDLLSALEGVQAALNRLALPPGWRIDDPQARQRMLNGVVAACLEALSEADRAHYMDLAAFTAGEEIPLAAAGVLWNLDLYQARDLAVRLADHALLSFNLERETLFLHPALYHFLYEQAWAGQLPQLHARLVDGYKARCSKGWASGPDDGYFFQHLARHLDAAGRQTELQSLFFDFDWLAGFLNSTPVRGGRSSNLYDLLGDYERALSTALDRQSAQMRLVQDALLLSAPVLMRDPAQLAPQLLGRLMPFNEPEIQAMISRAREWHSGSWLRPLAACFTPPGGNEVRSISGHGDWVTGVVLLPDGQRAVSSSLDGKLRVLNLANGQTLSSIEAHASGVSAVRVTEDGQTAVTSGWDGQVRVWNLATGQLVREFPAHLEPVAALQLTPDGKRIITGSDDRLVRVWDLDTGKKQLEMIGHNDLVRALAVSPDGRSLVSGSWDGTLRLWDLENGSLMHILTGHTGWVRSVIFSADGYNAISGAWDSTVRVWDLWTGETLQTLSGLKVPILSLALTPDNRTLITGGGGGALRLWDFKTGAPLHDLIGHRGGINELALTSSGHFLISASDDCSVRIWDLMAVQGSELQPAHRAAVPSLSVLPGGSAALSGSGDGTIKVWQIDNGSTLRSLKGHVGGVAAVAVTADGRTAVSGGRDRSVRVWNVVAGKERQVLLGHESPVTAVAVTPDGRVAVSGDESGMLRAWDLTSGICLAEFRGEGPIWACALTADGHRLTASAANGKMYFLEIQREQPAILIWILVRVHRLIIPFCQTKRCSAVRRCIFFTYATIILRRNHHSMKLADLVQHGVPRPWVKDNTIPWNEPGCSRGPAAAEAAGEQFWAVLAGRP